MAQQDSALPAPFFVQGLWNFKSFDDYRENWLKTNALPAVIQIFEGSRTQWIRDGMPKKGRGNFILAGVLLHGMEQMGMFLTGAGRPDVHKDPFWSRENIARVAKLMPSLLDVFALAGVLGRNPLTHIGWPQTALAINRRSKRGEDLDRWAVGLNISAEPERNEHNKLYVMESSLDPEPIQFGRESKVVILIVDDYVLTNEFVNAVVGDPEFDNVTKERWERVQDASRKMGRVPPHEWDALMRGNGRSICTNGRVREEAQMLQQEAEDLGAWDEPSQADRPDGRFMVPRPGKPQWDEWPGFDWTPPRQEK